MDHSRVAAATKSDNRLVANLPNTDPKPDRGFRHLIKQLIRIVFAKAAQRGTNPAMPLVESLDGGCDGCDAEAEDCRRI
ncbi:MAG: hypothetical protein IPJ21_19625 [Sterolibacteriaceae bacterium]|jgi:hypothetical protein|uniref:Uncharacterized protein n=1 Tax=Candidatus Methylophosphatis roskildensis TaxID=2899263 RepID=A0A9D7E5M0_9PROT|nr:hypothetical protein [Candidatus Methylophosphatis roskildensis]MBK7236976.1 hypothetical protein [Sterolibacteriaceae bacterium]MBK7665704.1 hypothetical protein [Sterolibacteriaceae bacterium]MBK9085944.1 hypothetical protein [Sterolibacteriaceae bacterium]